MSTHGYPRTPSQENLKATLAQILNASTKTTNVTTLVDRELGRASKESESDEASGSRIQFALEGS